MQPDLKLTLIWLKGLGHFAPVCILINITLFEANLRALNWAPEKTVNHEKENYIDTTENARELLDPAKVYRSHA